MRPRRLSPETRPEFFFSQESSDGRVGSLREISATIYKPSQGVSYVLRNFPTLDPETVKFPDAWSGERESFRRFSLEPNPPTVLRGKSDSTGC